MGPAAGSHADHPSEFDELSGAAWRPSWAPIPLLRGDLTAVPYLHDLIKSADAEDRARAAFLLGQIACPSSLPLLRAAKTDAVRSVRVHAGIALACMGQMEGYHTCTAALRGDADWVRYYAAFGLWNLQVSQAACSILHSLEYGQSPLVTTAIEGALNSPYVAPPAVDPLPQQPIPGPAPLPEQVWEQASDVFITESDWWFHKGDYEQAIRCSEASILLDPDYPETYSVVAWLEWSMGRSTDAVGTLRRSVASSPGDPSAWHNLGQHYFRVYRYDLAEAPLAKAVELGGDHLTVRTYAHCLERLGRPKDALRQWQSLRETRPDDGSVIVNLERLQRIIDGAGSQP